jgi:uncharacterized protein
MALIVQIKVIPSSGRQAWLLDKSGMLKCYLKSPPDKGKANKELVTFIAHSLSLPSQKIAILTGHTTRIKRITIDSPITLTDFLRLLGLEGGKQHALF